MGDGEKLGEHPEVARSQTSRRESEQQQHPTANIAWLESMGCCAAKPDGARLIYDDGAAGIALEELRVVATPTPAALAGEYVLGLTIETVSRQLTRLRGAGAIDLPSRREIVLRDTADLEARAG